MLIVPELNKVTKSTGAQVTCGTYHSPNILICKMMSVTKVLGTVLGTIMETIQQVFASFAFLCERKGLGGMGGRAWTVRLQL